MTTERQIAANRKNARKSTGPRSEAGKHRSRDNAFRHGLTAGRLIPRCEDGDEYRAFEAAVTAEFAPRTVIQFELAQRLALLLWRLRRATAIEAGLFDIQSRMINRERQAKRQAQTPVTIDSPPLVPVPSPQAAVQNEGQSERSTNPFVGGVPLTFLRLANLDGAPLEQLGRYETRLWRQAAQILIILDCTRR